MIRRRLPLLLAATALVASTGCDGIFGVDLPGGAAQGPTYKVTVVFDDVLDLVPQSAVRVDDVTVGDVEKISLDPGTFKANVVLRINKAVTLPRNAVAQVRQTSLLGEKFVELAPPLTEAPAGRAGRRRHDQLRSAAAATPRSRRCSRALSALLNGGGIGSLQTIAVELSAALAGREATVRTSLRHITDLVTALDQRKGDIVRAIDGAGPAHRHARASSGRPSPTRSTRSPRRSTVLADQQAELTRLLTHVARLGEVGTRVVNASRDDTVADAARCSRRSSTRSSPRAAT